MSNDICENQKVTKGPNEGRESNEHSTMATLHCTSLLVEIFSQK
jgi:hypothetical protein